VIFLSQRKGRWLFPKKSWTKCSPVLLVISRKHHSKITFTDTDVYNWLVIVASRMLQV
jgi:hypothetical protein